MVMQRLDEFLIGRVFQPAVNRMDAANGRALAAEFFLTGAMVVLLARMVVGAAQALPNWTVLLDLATLWGGMAVMQAVGMASGGRSNPLREKFRIVRRVLACIVLAKLATGSFTTRELLHTVETLLWCIALYFASCDAPALARRMALGGRGRH